eukprot:gene267-420_t
MVGHRCGQPQERAGKRSSDEESRNRNPPFHVKNDVDNDEESGAKMRTMIEKYSRKVTIIAQNCDGCDLGGEKIERVVREEMGRAGVMLLSEVNYDKGACAETGGGDAEQSSEEGDGGGKHKPTVEERIEEERIIVATNGAAIIITDGQLRKEYEMRKADGKTVVKAMKRIIMVFLEKCVLAAYYGPHTGFSASDKLEFDNELIAAIRAYKGDRGERWKSCVFGGDLNAILPVEDGDEHGADEEGGEAAAGARNAMAGEGGTAAKRGKAVIRKLKKQFFVPMNKGRAGTYNGHEIDYLIGPARCAQHFSGFAREKHDGFQHSRLRVEMKMIPTPKVLTMVNNDRKSGARMGFPKKLSDAKSAWFNSKLMGTKSMSEFHAAMVEMKPEVMEKMEKPQQPGGDSGEGSGPAWRKQSETWQYLKAISRSTRAEPQISAQAAMEQYRSVSSAETPTTLQDIIDATPEFPPELLQEFDRDIGADEVKAAVAGMKLDGGADAAGLKPRVLSYFNGDVREHLAKMMTDESSEEAVRAWADEIRSVVVGYLWKGKGKKTDAKMHRFTSTSSVSTKLYDKVLQRRMDTLLTKSGFYTEAMFGFRSGRGPPEGIALDARIGEDARTWSGEGFQVPWKTAEDIGKAFPSFNANTTEAIGRKSGLHSRRMWRSLIAVHRNAIFLFRGKKGEPTIVWLGQINGFKEGAASSSTLYVFTYGCLFLAFRARRDAKFGEMNTGLRLFYCGHHDSFSETATESVEKIFYAEETTVQIMIVGESLFADDTNLYEDICRRFASELEAAIKENDRRSEADRLNLGTDMVKVYEATVLDGGTRINIGKKEQGAAAWMVCKYLGVWTNQRADCEHKIAGAWKNFFSFRKKISMTAIDRKCKGGMWLAACRTKEDFGLTSRGTAEWELERYQRIENDMLQQLASLPFWKLRLKKINMSDVRRNWGVTEIKTWVFYQKSRCFGHVCRMDDSAVVKRAVLGKFIPRQEGGQEVARKYFAMGAQEEVKPAKEAQKATILGDVHRHLVKECKVPFRAISFLVERTGEEKPTARDYEMKDMCYRLTREQYIRAVMADYEKGKEYYCVVCKEGAGGDCEQNCEGKKKEVLDKCREEMCEEFLGKEGNRQLDTHKKYFRRNYCFICNDEFCANADASENPSEQKIAEELNRHIEEQHLNKWKTGRALEDRRQQALEVAEQRKSTEERILMEYASEFSVATSNNDTNDADTAKT